MSFTASVTKRPMEDADIALSGADRFLRDIADWPSVQIIVAKAWIVLGISASLVAGWTRTRRSDSRCAHRGAICIAHTV